MDRRKIGNSTWKSHRVPRGKNHSKTETKTTISIYLDKELVKRAKNSGLNLSKVTEQALSSILDYIQTQNINISSDFSLSQGSLFQKEKSVVARKRFELLSRAPEAPMLDHYTTGLQCKTKQASVL